MKSQTHHLCIHDAYCTFDGELLPFGKESIEKDITKAINEVLDIVIHKIGEGDVVVCGTGDARRMLGRKLEDRLGREVRYE
jgi:5-methylthioribose kinase